MTFQFKQVSNRKQIFPAIKMPLKNVNMIRTVTLALDKRKEVHSEIYL